jgi:hypothetical protein
MKKRKQKIWEGERERERTRKEVNDYKGFEECHIARKSGMGERTWKEEETVREVKT